MITPKPEKLCPCCTKPILRKMAFCRTCWFLLPIALRTRIEEAQQGKNFQAKAAAMTEALGWHRDRKAGVQTEMLQYQPLNKNGN